MNVSSSSQTQISPSDLNYDLKHSNNKKNAAANKVSISWNKNSKKNGLLKSLMKQKEQLTEDRNKIMEEGAKNKEDPKSIKAKLDDIDKQIDSIDQQISKLQVEDTRKAIGKDKDNDTAKKKTKASSSNVSTKTKNDVSMENLLSITNNLSRSKALSAQRVAMQGEKGVLDAEIKIDKGRGLDTANKEKRVSEITENIENISEKISENIGDINNKIKNNIESSSSSDNNSSKEESGDVKSNKEHKNMDKSSVHEKKITKNIEHYKKIMDTKDSNDSQKLSATA